MQSWGNGSEGALLGSISSLRNTVGKSPVLTLVVVVVGLGAGIFFVWRQQQPPPPPAPIPEGVSTFSDPPPKPVPSTRSSGAAAARRGAAGADGASLQPGVVVSGAEKPAPTGAGLSARPTGAGPRGVAAPDASVVSPRRTLFLSGSTASWSRLDVELNRPFRLQAGGRVELGTDAAGPNGVPSSRARGTQGQVTSNDLLIPSAPYLSLIGRVCSPRECSAPFLVGTRTVLCPSLIGVEGNLELWTNNRVREGRSQTRSNFSGATGGFHVYLEPAQVSACGKPAAEIAFANEDAAELASGRTIERPEFVISSSQSAWKPFFLPLDQPLRIQASGEMRPVKSAEPTGPDGIAVPDVPRWTYPGTQVVIDAEHPLFNPNMPYQALVGRVCGTAGCGQMFVIGRDRTVCASPAFRDHLEIWINHIVPSRGLLARVTPLTMDTFDLQTRTGDYRFRVSSAPPSACGG